MAKLMVPDRTALVFEFVSQVVIGSGAFLAFSTVTAVLSVLLNGINHFIAPLMDQDVANSLLWAFRGGEFFLFGADFLAFGMFVLSEVLTFGRALIRYWKEPDA
jgi:hypothetical protein